MRKCVMLVLGLIVVVSFGGVADAVESEESKAASKVQAAGQLSGTGFSGPVAVPIPTESDPVLKWATPDIVVTNGLSDQATPAVASAPSGELFSAVNEINDDSLHIYHSTDGGETWSMLFSMNHGTETRNPALTYAENSGVRYVVMVYERVGADTDRGLHAVRVDVDDPYVGYLFTSIDASITWLNTTTQLHPQITCDFPDYSSLVYFYVTWAQPSIDYYPVYFSASTDQAATWDTPLNITGGSENTSVESRPEIAYSAYRNDVYVAFNKPGWTGTEWAPQIWVAANTSSGGSSSWLPAVQVSSSEYDEFSPSVAAAWDSDTVIVAWTKAYSTDNDVMYSISTDGGAVWSYFYHMSSWTFEDEDNVDLTVSQQASGRFHIAYRHDDPAITSGGDIWYSWADVTTPDTWSSALDVDEGSITSGLSFYPRPAICVDLSQAPEDEAALSWSTYLPDYRVLFDSATLGGFSDLIFADGFESGNLLQWSSSVP